MSHDLDDIIKKIVRVRFIDKPILRISIVTEMFSPDNGANVYENGMSQSKLENVKLQSSTATPTRNTIRTSPNAHKIQQNGQSSNDNNYANIFNFTEDYNFQGKV